MTDITGNFGVNTHSYTSENIGKKASQPANGSCHGEEVKKPEINLDNDPNAISGKTLVKSSTVGKKASSDYQFDPKNIENDVREFQAYQAAAEVAEDYEKELIEKGCDPNIAANKKEAFLSCLLTHNFLLI